MTESTALITDESTFSARWYVANTEFMAVNLGDRISGVFWAAFLLFSWTAASIVSGAIIERVTTFAFGKSTINSYIKLKTSELKEFKRKNNFNKKKPITAWEKINTLDC